MKTINRVYYYLQRVLKSRKFFYLVLLLIAFQGLWNAVSLTPRNFDEPVHVGTVYYFAENPNPYIGTQPHEWDYLGAVTRNDSYIFYYLLSIPLRFVSVFTESQMVQVFTLRLIMIVFFVIGVIFMRRAMLIAGISSAFVSVSFLLVMLMPNISILPGIVNYDNAVFMLFSIALYLLFKTYTSKDLKLLTMIGFIATITLGLNMKPLNTFALYAPLLVFFTAHLIRNSEKVAFKKMIIEALDQRQRVLKIFMSAVLILSVAALIERPIGNLVRYGNIQPACNKILSQERCDLNFIAERNNRLREEKPQGFKPYSPYEYLTIFWIPSMVNTNLRISPSPAPFPIVQMTYFTIYFTALVLVLTGLKEFFRNKFLSVFFVSSVFLVAAVFAGNYKSYVSSGLPLAMNGRYLLPVLPIFGVLALTSLNQIAGLLVKKILVTVVLPVTLILILQGGSITTTLIGTNNYWNNSYIIRVNTNLKVAVKRVIVERTPFLLF